MIVKLAIAVVGTLVVLGVAIAAVALLDTAEDDAVKLAPADAFVYVNAFLDPSTDQKVALRDLLEKFPEAATPDEAKDAIARLVDEALEETGLTFEDDVDPWLGKQIAFFLTPPTAPTEEPDGALLIATEDPSATRDALEEAFANSARDADDRSYEGVEYRFSADDDAALGVVDDFLVAGNEDGFEDVVDVSQGAVSLRDSERWGQATSKLTEDRLAVYYLDFMPVFDVLADTGGLPPGMVSSGLFGPLEQPVAAVLFARRNGVVLEGSIQRPREGVGASEPGLLPRLPGDSWLAVGASNVGRRLEATFQSLSSSGFPGLTPEVVESRFRAQTGLDLRRDLFSWIGDIGVFVRGTTTQDLSGGLVIDSLDPTASARAVGRLDAVARRFGAPVRRLPLRGFDGFALKEPGVPEPVFVVARGDRVVVTYGKESTLRALGSHPSLGGTDVYEDALDAVGSDFSPGGLLSIAPVLELADRLGADRDPTYQREVKPFLEPLAFVVFGSKLDGDTFVQRVVIGVR